MISRIVLFLILLFPGLSQSSEILIKNKAYIQGIIGRSGQGESETAPDTVKDEQEPEAGTGGSVAIGYRWERFALELIYTNFGTTKNNIGDDMYMEEHKASFIGGGLHWTWSWFDLKLGWGTGNDKVTYEKGPLSTTFSADPTGEGSSGSGGYFGIGVNFDLGRRTEFVIEYTGYAWSQKDPQTITVDGDTEVSEDFMTRIGIIGLGLRRFF